MGFFSNTLRAARGIARGIGDAVGDVVEGGGDYLLGQRGQRGSRIGSAVGGFLDPTGSGVGEVIGGQIGAGISADISAAPKIQAQRNAAKRNDDALLSVPDRPITEQDYLNLARGGEIYTAGLRGGNSMQETGTVLDIRLPKYVEPIGTGMEILGDIYDYFTEGDDAPGTQMMCPIQGQPRPYNINRNTGCISITRKQQTKLKEAVRMFGGATTAKNIGISQATLQQLLLKTFRSRRRGISGADMRAVKRVDRQMHSLACALGGISTTAKAVGQRKAPPARKC